MSQPGAAKLKGVEGGLHPSRAHRFGMRVGVAYRERGQPQWLHAQTINLSRTGLLMDCESAPEVGAPLELVLEFGPPLANLSCSARVVRATQSDRDGRWRVAASIFRYAFLPKDVQMSGLPV